jgi:3-oxoacyl-[acyl-carrier protein] reductase
LRLAARGASLDLIGRDSAALDETRSELARIGAQVRFIACDLAHTRDVLRAGRALVEGEAPDVLINNAATIERVGLEALTPESWDHQLAVNLRAPTLLSQAVVPKMRTRGSGRILHVASISATLGTAKSATYNASKWGLVGFMKSLAEELSDSGVMTCAILPGSVDTEMLLGSGFAPRMTGADVARTLEYYALDAPLAHNGACIEMFAS